VTETGSGSHETEVVMQDGDVGEGERSASSPRGRSEAEELENARTMPGDEDERASDQLRRETAINISRTTGRGREMAPGRRRAHQEMDGEPEGSRTMQASIPTPRQA
jgi:hypothetical protein